MPSKTRKPESSHGPWFRFMEAALRLARKAADLDEVPVGAVVVHEGKIIGRGHNLRESKNDPCGHAEIMAIRSAARKRGSWRLEDATLVVTLEPCPMCLAACQQARLARVVFGARDPKGGALSLGYSLHSDSRLNHRFLAIEELFLPAGEILRDFFRAKRANRKPLKA